MRRLLLVLVALVLGVGAGEWLTTSFSFRHWLGQVVRRGELQALVGHRGIYQSDVERAWQAELFAVGADPGEIDSSLERAQKHEALQGLIGRAKLSAAAAGQSIPPGAVAHEMDLLRAQFSDDKTWRNALVAAGLSRAALQREAAANLRARAWLERQVASRLRPNEPQIRQIFEEQRAAFQEPLRFRANHLFLAAPEGYPNEVIEAKRALIFELSKRLANGESFPALVAEFSEDDATKKRDGDLGYFAEGRMLPAVFEAATQLQPGQISAPIRSRLGFHILRLTDARPARSLTLAEARPEIALRLANEKRAETVAGMVATLP
ncbi:MAG: peptidylprolyl isomerase [Spartobacteria bacterium]